MEVKLPNLGEGAESGTVVSLLVSSGDTVEKDQTLIEIENEKAVAPIPAPAAGKIGEIRISEGDSVSVGQVILILDDGAGGGDSSESSDSGESSSQGSKPAAPASSGSAPSGGGPRPGGMPMAPAPGFGFGFPQGMSAPAAAPSNLPSLHDIWIPGAVVHSADSSAAKAGFSPPASPSIRRTAAELGIDLMKVPGSGSGGRITTEDLKAYVGALHQAVEVLMGHLQAMSAGPGAAPAPEKPKPKSIDFSQWGEVKKEPLSSLRKTISRRMTEHWNDIPHVTQFDSVDVTDLNALRKKLAPSYKEKGARLTMTPFVMKALVQALDKHSVFASSLDEATQELVYKQYRHVGIAVDTEAGLVVPVIRDVDKKSLLELSAELSEMAEKAKDRKLSGDDMSGGVITISNQGAIGGAHFTPIVNKPEVAIVGLGRGAMQPAVVGEKILPRLMMPVTLSYDHRVIDGGTAARFMVDFVEAFKEFNEENSAA